MIAVTSWSASDEEIGSVHGFWMIRTGTGRLVGATNGHLDERGSHQRRDLH